MIYNEHEYRSFSVYVVYIFERNYDICIDGFFYQANERGGGGQRSTTSINGCTDFSYFLDI